MKGVVFGLLLANCLYASWQIFIMPTSNNRSGDVVEGAAFPVQEIASVALISEVPSEALRLFRNQPDVAASDAITGGDSSVLGAPGYCIEIGPFEDIPHAQTVIDAFAAIVPMTVESRSIVGAIEYRVFLPPFPDIEIAGQTLDALRSTFEARNLAIDTFLITRGEMANGIALGLFGEHRNAVNVREQMRSLGYEVAVREEVKSVEEYWLLSQQIDSREVFDSSWIEIESSVPAVQAVEKLCQTIAQETQFP